MKYKKLKPIESVYEETLNNGLKEEGEPIGMKIAMVIFAIFVVWGILSIGADIGFKNGVNYGTNQMAGVQTQYGIVYYLSNSTGNWTIDSIKITDICANIGGTK